MLGSTSSDAGSEEGAGSATSVEVALEASLCALGWTRSDVGNVGAGVEKEPARRAQPCSRSWSLERGRGGVETVTVERHSAYCRGTTAPAERRRSPHSLSVCGMLTFQLKRLPIGHVCKLYTLNDILKLARATHIARPITSLQTLKDICVALGLSPVGSYDILRNRVTVHLAGAAQM